ncbi:MAG: TonB-dependent receptor [Bacteroidales bacterium]|nr:TonB-dependent receptor [Bacteroidales bacterium]
MNKKKLLVVCMTLALFFGRVSTNYAQNQNVICVVESYSFEPLDKVIDDLSVKYNLKFKFKREDLQEYDFSYMFSGTKLETAVSILVRNKPLSYMIDQFGVIHIVKKTTQSDTGISNVKFDGVADKKDITISGIVKDNQTGETLPFVNVVVATSLKGASTNVDGFFTLFHVPTDTSTLVLSYIGYEKMEFFLNPKMDIQQIVIEMQPALTSIEGVEIICEREDLLQTNKEVSIVKMNPKNLSALPNAGERDVLRALQLMPGISASNEASSGLYVRGGTPDQNLVLYDGFTVYHVDHLFGFYSAFNPNAIKDVQLHKGGFQSKFGGRLSSVTELTGKDGNQKELNIGAEVGLLSVNAFAEIPINSKISTLVAFRRSWKSPLYDNIFNKFNSSSESSEQFTNARMASFATEVASYFYDLNAKVTYRPTDNDNITLSFFNGTDDLDNSRIMDTPEKFASRGIDMNMNIVDLSKWGNTGGSLKWSRKWSPIFYSNNLLSYSQFFSERERSTTREMTLEDGTEMNFANGTVEDNNLQDFTFKSDHELKLGSSNQILFGLQATYNSIQYTYIQNDTISILERDDAGFSLAGYLQDRITLFDDRFVFQPGLRYTYYNVTGETYFEPRASLSFEISDKFKIKGAWGHYNQFVNKIVREDVLSGDRDFWIMSNGEEVPVGNSIHYIAGLSYETKGYLFDIETYYKTLTGLTEYSMQYSSSFRNISYEENFYNGTGFARGVEFLFQKKFGNYNGWLGYTLGEVIYEFPDLANTVFPASHDATHEFKIVNTYKWKKWDFGATWVFATGKPYTAPEGGYEVGLLDGSTASYVTTGDRNGLRLPDYHRMDLSAKYNFTIGPGKSPASLGFSLFNVYNRKNLWYKEYEVIEDEIIETDVNFMGITPNISLNISLR